MLRLGNIYLERKSLKDAKKVFLRCCDLNPTASSFLGLGLACLLLGDMTVAEDALTEANIKDNCNSVIWLALTLFGLKGQRRLQAEQTFREAMACPRVSASNELFEMLGDEFSKLSSSNPI